jgi:hypothetical protein
MQGNIAVPDILAQPFERDFQQDKETPCFRGSRSNPRPHKAFKSSEKAFATTKLLSDILSNISKIKDLCSADLALAPATLKGKKYDIPARFVVLSANSAVCKMFWT